MNIPVKHALKRRLGLACAALGLAGWRPLAHAAEPAAAAAADQPLPPDLSARNPDWATRVGDSRNFFRVSPTLYRSGQLGRADVAALVPLGIKTVVGLRAFHSDDTWLRESGIQIRRIKIYTWRISDDDVVAALQAIRAAEQQGPVLLHCWHGADRTGLVAAMYRVLFQGWSKQQALDELLHGGYGYHALWKNIPTYLHQVDVEKIRQRLAAS